MLNNRALAGYSEKFILTLKSVRLFSVYNGTVDPFYFHCCEIQQFVIIWNEVGTFRGSSIIQKWRIYFHSCSENWMENHWIGEKKKRKKDYSSSKSQESTLA